MSQSLCSSHAVRSKSVVVDVLVIIFTNAIAPVYRAVVRSVLKSAAEYIALGIHEAGACILIKCCSTRAFFLAGNTLDVVRFLHLGEVKRRVERIVVLHLGEIVGLCPGIGTPGT